MKRFNYTGRKKIYRDDVKIHLHGDFDEKPVVDVTIDLRNYEFPQTAAVFLEAQQHKTRFMREKLGNACNSVRQNNIKLTEFDDAEQLNFRVKVVDEDRGLLLGTAEHIKLFNKDDKLDENQKSILPVSSADLSAHGVLWRIEQDDQNAILQVERALGSRDQVVRSLMFKAFILPAAMRQILIRILSDGWDDELSDSAELSTRWLLFSLQLGAPPPPQKDLNTARSEEHEAWIDDVVRLLTNKIGVRKQVIEDFSAGEWK